MKDKNVYEEYRDRLLENTNDVLKLEIYETFAGRDFVDNTLELVELLEIGSAKDIIKELEQIQKNIFEIQTNKYTTEEKIGFYLIAQGYIYRFKSDLQINKQEIMQEKLKRLRSKYTKGTKIELVKMHDFQAPMKGTRGIVEYVDDIGNIHMKWENGSSLSLIEGIDLFKIVKEMNEK